jgi:CRISPR-associated protein Cas2
VSAASTTFLNKKSLFLINLKIMYYCVAYDISNNKLRLKVIKWCKQAGLQRLQKSVFTGPSNGYLIQDLETEVKAILPKTDRFCIIPMDNVAWQKMLLLGSGASKAALERKEKVRYF